MKSFESNIGRKDQITRLQTRRNFSFCLLIASFFLPICLTAQTNTSSTGYFVIIGTFAYKENASRFMSVISKEGYDAQKMPSLERLHQYIYLDSYSSFEKAARHAAQVRSRFNDVWVKCVGCEESQLPLSGASPSTDKNDSLWSATVKHDYFSLKKVSISVFDTINSRPVEGEIQVIDPSNSTLLKKMKTDSEEQLPWPESGKLLLVCQIFGYHKVQQEISVTVSMLSSTQNQTRTPNRDLVKINLQTSPYKKGDFLTLDKIQFFKDASIMYPESRQQLDEVAQFLKSNNIKVRLHGHTNGKHRGKIVRPNASNNFFTLEDSEVTRGSAESLSRWRAEVIKRYLTDSNISADRVEVKAWGGKRLLFDEEGEDAHKNMRVELEIR